MFVTSCGGTSAAQDEANTSEDPAVLDESSGQNPVEQATEPVPYGVPPFEVDPADGSPALAARDSIICFDFPPSGEGSSGAHDFISATRELVTWWTIVEQPRVVKSEESNYGYLLALDEAATVAGPAHNGQSAPPKLAEVGSAYVALQTQQRLLIGLFEAGDAVAVFIPGPENTWQMVEDCNGVQRSQIQAAAGPTTAVELNEVILALYGGDGIEGVGRPFGSYEEELLAKLAPAPEPS